MDAFEPVRKSAARLYSEMVTSGADPLSPMSLVNAAVARLELELCWLPKDDPTLKGARPPFDEQSGTICCEEAGDIGEPRGSCCPRNRPCRHAFGFIRMHRARHRWISKHRGMPQWIAASRRLRSARTSRTSSECLCARITASAQSLQNASFSIKA